MSGPPTNGTSYQLSDHERRIRKLEDAKIDVLANDLKYLKRGLDRMEKNMEERLDAMEDHMRDRLKKMDTTNVWIARTFVGIAVAVVIAVLVYAAVGGQA